MESPRARPGCIPFVLAAVLAAGCGRDGGDDPARLRALALDVEGREDVARNQPLTLTFTDDVDPESVGLDTVQVRRGAPGEPRAPGGPPSVLGRYEVRRNRVLFHPTVNPLDPNPLGLPLNPFGFDALTGYHVLLPTADGARRLRSAGGRPLARGFTASFRTGSGWLLEVPAVAPRVVRAPDTNGNPDDDLLSFDPPGPEPMDRRRELDSRVTISVTFTEPMDPASVNPEPAAGSFRVAETNLARGIAGTVSWSPDGRTFTFTPSGGLGHETIARDYLATLTEGLRDLAGNAAALEGVRPEELAFHTRLSPGENGPLLQTLLPFTAPDVDRDPTATDDDVAWGTYNPPPRDRLGPASIRTREHPLEPACLGIPQPPVYCPFLDPQPLNTCDGPTPNQDCDPCTSGGQIEHRFSRGAKLQLLYLARELRPNGGPQQADRLTDSEAITGVDWGPRSNFLFRTRYAGVTVRMGHTTANELNGGLTLFYDLNYNAGSPPVEVFPPGNYDVPERRDAVWFPWPQTRSFGFDGTNSLILEVNVPDPRVEDPQATYQLFRNQSTALTPYRRVLSQPGQPMAGCGDRTVYHHRFHLAKQKHLAVTRFLDLGRGTFLPLHAPPTVFPRADQLPPGTGYALRFQGADSASGAGATAWSADVRVADRKRFLRLEVVFSSDARALVRPWIDWIALGYAADR